MISKQRVGSKFSEISKMEDRIHNIEECGDLIEELRAQLEETQETLRAIRSGEVDALVVSGPQGNQVYTLQGAESTYRLLVEAMNEGALVLTSDGTVMYSNSAFADMVDVPLDQVIGTQIHHFVCDSDAEIVDQLLEKVKLTGSKHELALKNQPKDKVVPAQVSVAILSGDETTGISAVVTDLTEHKRTEVELEQYRHHLEDLVEERTEQLRLATEDLEASNEKLRLTNNKLIQEVNERKRAEGELIVAKDIAEHQTRLLQRALIPARPPVVEGYPVASAYVPAFVGTEIGGDFLDVFRTEDSKVGILIGDVAGKGIEAAALAATTRSRIRAFAYDSSSPGDVLTHANSLLSTHQVDDMQFVTAFLVILDPATGDIVCSGAGHPPAIISGEGGDADLLLAPNMPLGVMNGVQYKEGHSVLKPGDRLILYTDGVTEARHDHTLFGTEGLKSVLSMHPHASPDELVEEILDSVRDWAYGKLRDDTAILVVHREK